jgi:hypothetical protein
MIVVPRLGRIVIAVPRLGRIMILVPRPGRIMIVVPHPGHIKRRGPCTPKRDFLTDPRISGKTRLKASDSFMA